MISACTAAGDIDKSLKNLKQNLIGKEKSRVKDGRVLARLESVIVIQVQFHIIGNWFVLILVGGWNVNILMKARPSLSFQAIIDVAQRKFIILKMRANTKRGCDFRRLKSVK